MIDRGSESAGPGARSLNSTFGAYLLVGGLASLLDIGLFVAFVQMTGSVLPSAVASFLLAACANYVASSTFVYRMPWRSRRRAMLWTSVAALGLVLNAGVTFVVATLGYPHALAKATGIVSGLAITFLGNTFVSFRARPQPH